MGDLGDAASLGPVIGVNGRYGINDRVSVIGEIDYFLFGSEEPAAGTEISSKGLVDRSWKRLDSWIPRSKMAIRHWKNSRRCSNLLRAGRR